MPVIIGDNKAVEDNVIKNYSGEWQLVLEVDPADNTRDVFSDWEGYIYVKENSGNAVDYELRSVVGGIEYVEASGTIGGNQTAKIRLTDTVKHRLYIKSNDGTSTGQVQAAYRISYYK